MILITGSAGFIGSAIAAFLNRQGRADLVLCDTLGTGEKWQNLVGLKFAEIIAPSELFAALATRRDIETVIHMGACSATTETDADYLLANNTQFSSRLCRWSLENGARFIYASSAATYGDGALGFSDDPELTFKLKPLNAYGFSKWLFDCEVVKNRWHEQVCGLRFFNVFGPNEYHKESMASVVYRAFPLAAREGRVRLFESYREGIPHGEQRRDFVYIDDSLAVIDYLLKRPSVHGIFNVGSGIAHSFNELARGVFAGLGIAGRIEYFPMPEELRDRYQYYTVADLSRLTAAGFARLPDRFEEHVARYVREYLRPGLKQWQDGKREGG
ncbi:ADP-glyceromanno-heptose 6-epimerase [candidate division KSB1 bacterium]|nr:ADP-glyceromanno-heptose 6-epimerase [candidate division KSB1 bacterium]